MTNRKKILISLVHNNKKERLDIVKPNVNKLLLELENNNNVDYFESNYQPVVKPVNVRVGFLRDLMYLKLERQWNKYKEIKNNFFPFVFFIFILKTIYKYILNRDLKNRWLKSCSIEIFVTNKHIESIFNAFRNDVDFLLVFEDDAIFKDDSIKNVLDLLNNLIINDNPLYIDLAGGCELSKLKISKLQFKKDDYFRYYTKPVTNTACCYLIK